VNLSSGADLFGKHLESDLAQAFAAENRIEFLDPKLVS
jgi:hypothetical protein